MTTSTTSTTSIDPRLLQLASPTLPVGAYSYSGGLEAAIEAGLVTDAQSAQRWIGDVLEHSVMKMEAPILLRLIEEPEARWNEEFLDEHFRFPLGSHDDQVDASSGAFNRLALYLDEIAHGTAPSDERIEAELAGAGIPASEMGGSFLDHELF